MDRQGAIRARRAFDRSLIGGQHIRVNWHCSETPNNEAALKLEAKPDKFPLSSETDLQGGVKERSPTSVYFRFENLNVSDVLFELYCNNTELLPIYHGICRNMRLENHTCAQFSPYMRPSTRLL